MLFVGIDWAEDHHDVCLMDDAGKKCTAFRIPDSLEGIETIHSAIADHADETSDVVIGIETDHGLLARAMIASGYQVYVINPLSASRYRDRHTPSKAKSDTGDAAMLANIVRTDRQNHRPYVGNSDLSEAVKVLARSHHSLIWTRQRQLNQLRATLRQFYPAALDAFENLGSPDAFAVLAAGPTPERGKRLTVHRIEKLLVAAGRKRRANVKAGEIHTVLHSAYAEAPPLLAEAYGDVVLAIVATCQTLTAQIAQLERKFAQSFDQHPDANIILSLPGLGQVLGARVLAEFGDAPNRFHDAKCRKNFAGTSPITRASGTKFVVLARYAKSAQVTETCQQWAFCALTGSPGARALYTAQRAKGSTHRQAIRKVANRFVGVLHGCLRHRELYSEEHAWGHIAPLKESA